MNTDNSRLHSAQGFFSDKRHGRLPFWRKKKDSVDGNEMMRKSCIHSLIVIQKAGDTRKGGMNLQLASTRTKKYESG